MALQTLKILLVLYILYALLKFFNFFFQRYDTRIKAISAAYSGGGRVLRMFDNVILVFMIVLVGLLFVSGVEYISFTTGLLVGMTII
jgi:hypothetical protein